MRRKHRILLDCDGVLADWLTPALAIVHRETGKQYTPEDFTSWDIFKQFTADGFDAKNLAQDIFQGINLRNLSVYPGAQEAVKELQTLGDVIVVTAACDVLGRRAWLREHFDLGAEHLIHAQRKEYVLGDMLVDDNPDHVEAWDRAWPKAPGGGLLYAMPYNREHLKDVRLVWDGIIVEARVSAMYHCEDGPHEL